MFSLILTCLQVTMFALPVYLTLVGINFNFFSFSFTFVNTNDLRVGFKDLFRTTFFLSSLDSVML